MITDVSINGLNKVRGYEGRALRAYQDSVGVWTIGYGLTNYDKGLPFRVGPGVTITAEQAEWLLYKHLRTDYLPEVERRINQSRVAHPQGAIDGGVSFHYNTGGIGRASWTAKLNAGEMAGAEAAFKSWCKAGGRVLGGLVRRRADEWNMIAHEQYGHMTGPGIEDGPRGHETGRTAALLTAYPTPPSGEKPGNVHTDGPPVPTTPAPGALHRGDSGPEVTAIQEDLNEAGFPCIVDGRFGPGTEQAVIAFQKTHPQITADGTVGPATRAALHRDALMRRAVKKVGKGTAGGGVATATVWHKLSEHIGEVMFFAGAAVLVACVLYLGWTYRNEIHAAFNKLIGRTVV